MGGPWHAHCGCWQASQGQVWFIFMPGRAWLLFLPQPGAGPTVQLTNRDLLQQCLGPWMQVMSSLLILALPPGPGATGQGSAMCHILGHLELCLCLGHLSIHH